MFPFLDSAKAIQQSNSFSQSQTKFKKILSKRIESAYANTLFENQKEENLEDKDEVESNIYCINNKNLSNASKVRLIKKVEKTEFLELENGARERNLTNTNKNIGNSTISSQKMKNNFGSKTDFSINQKGRNHSTISFLKGLENQYSKLNLSNKILYFIIKL